MQTAANSKDENLDLENVTSEEYPEETGSCPLLVLNVPSQFSTDNNQQDDGSDSHDILSSSEVQTNQKHTQAGVLMVSMRAVG